MSSPRRRAPWPAALALLVVLLAAVSVPAVGSTSSTPANASTAVALDGPLAKERQAAADQRAAARARELESGEARQRRAASRERFRGQGPAETVVTAREQHPLVFGARPWQPIAKADGAKVARYVGDKAAVLESGEHRTWLESTVPLRAPAAGPDARPLDLELRDRGGYFEPENPLVGVQLPSRLKDGMLLPGGVRLRPVTGPDVSEAQRMAGRLLYANAAADTDVVLAPHLGAGQILWQLRSPASPETLAVEVDLPAGTTLVETSDGGAAVARGDDRTLRITAPMTSDADGQPVPTRLVVVGEDRLEVRVDHHAREVRYPLAVDPLVDAYWLWPGSNVSFAGWGRSTNRPTGDFWLSQSSGAYGRGLHSFAGGGRYFPAESFGQWIYKAPGTTRIFKILYHSVIHQPANTHHVEGIYSHERSAFDSGWMAPTSTDTPATDICEWRNCVGSPYWGAESVMHQSYLHCLEYFCREGTPARPTGTPGNAAVLSLHLREARTQHNEARVYMDGAVVHLSDFDAPKVIEDSAHDAGTGWIGANQTKTAIVKASDAGLGLYSVAIDSRERSWSAGWPSLGCTGGHDSRCETIVQTVKAPLDTNKMPEGIVPLSARAFDPLNNISAYRSLGEVKVDRSGPRFDVPTGELYDRRDQTISDEASVTVNARDGVPFGRLAERASGVQRVEASLTYPDGRVVAQSPAATKTQTCTAPNPNTQTEGVSQDSCPLSRDYTFSTADAEYPPGRYTIRFVAYDHVGNASEPTSWSFTKTDKPALKVEGGLRSSPLASGRSLSATATDQHGGVREIRVYVKPRPAGTVAPDDADPTDAELIQDDDCVTACTGDGGFSSTYEWPENKPGRHQITVRAWGTHGQMAEDRWVVHVVALRTTDRSKLGLEQWFDVDETDAGGESKLYVNGETGNVVWHHVPIVNPGRGLSTVVNLTYNSHDRGGILGGRLGRVPVVGQQAEDTNALDNDFAGFAYREAGVGFSLAVGGPTRVNDPLAGVLTAGALERTHASHDTPWTGTEGRVALTDADGTRHVFTRPAGSTGWIAPPGVDMRLRYVGTRGAGPLGPLTGAELGSDPGWELLRPDGVRFGFDRFGYQRTTSDRNGNQLTYAYDYVNAVTGVSCSADTAIGRLTAGVGLCVPQLSEVRQPTWAVEDDPATRGDERRRRIALTYTDRSGEAGDLLAAFGQPAGTLMGATYAMGGGGQVDTITDASGREYDLDYSTVEGVDGYLTEVRENDAGSPTPGAVDARRTTRLRYAEPAIAGDPADLRPGDAEQLTAVVPVVGDQEQEATSVVYAPRVASDPIRPPAPRRAARVDKRGAGHKLLRYQAAQGDTPTSFAAHELVHRQATGARYLTQETQLDGEGRPTQTVERTTTLEGATDAELAADQSAAPVAGQGQSTTQLVWDGDNKVTKTTENPGADRRTTDFTYSALTGVLEDRTVTGGGKSRRWDLDYDAVTADVPDDADIADLTKAEMPGGRTWTFEPDALTGNVEVTVTPATVRMQTVFGAGGVVTSQQDEMLRATTSADFDAGGLAQTVTLPGDRVYGYRYDDRGDVTAVVDPRGSARDAAGGLAALGEDDPYVTTLAYDPFSRLVRERIPRLSDPTPEAPAPAPTAAEGPAFVQRTRVFDRDGNATSMTDPRDLVTSIGYDADGQATAVHRPGSQATETTRYVNDEAQRVIAQATPKAAWGDPAATATSVRDEHLDVCETPTNTTRRAFLTRFCLDHRGRPLAQVQTATGPETDDLPRRITSFAYDAFDNVVGVADANRNAVWVNRGQPTERQDPVSVPEAVFNAGDATDQRWTFAYDLLDRRRTATEHPTEADKADRIRTWVYDAEDDLTSVSLEDGANDRVTAYTHDAMGRQVSQTDPLGRLSCSRRQADGLVTSVTTPRGSEGREASWCEAPVAANALFTSVMTYNDAQHLTSRTIPWDGRAVGGRDTAEDWAVTYQPDLVGNPTSITDGRGNQFRNWFLDTGGLRGTQRPSWWGMQWPADQGNPQAGGRLGGGDAADVEVAADGPAVVERSGRSANAERSGELPVKPESLGKTDMGETLDMPLPEWMPAAGDTHLRYDSEGRLTHVTDAKANGRRIDYDPAGRVSKKTLPLDARNIVHDFDYDPNGNLDRVTEDWSDDRRTATSYGYDGYDRRRSETTDGAHDGDRDATAPGGDLDAVTGFAYDANDNLRVWTTPRGVDVANAFVSDSLDQLTHETNADGQTWTYTYNQHGERVTEVTPHAPSANAAEYTATSTYDLAGQLDTLTRSTTDPDPGRGLRTLVTDFGYDRDGNRETVTEPGDPATVTRVDHDALGLPWRTNVMATGDSPAVRRTSITEHDANGNLRREVRPAGIDATTRLPETDDTGTNLRANLDAASSNARVFSYRADDLLQHERLPWAGAGDEQYVRSRGYEDDADDTGEVKWIALPSELPDGAGDPEPSEQRTSYTHNDAGWITTSTDEARGRPGSEEQRVRYSWNERGQQVQWRSSTVAQTGERDRHALRWAYWPNGLLRRREAVKRVPGSEPGSEQDDADPPKYDYLYNANRSVTRLVDEDADGRQPGDQTRTTVYTRDDAERPTRINERWADGETGSNDSRHADVELTYEPHTGQLASRRTDGRFETSTASDGRQTVSYAGDDRRQTAFTYDSLGRELTMTVDPTAADATDTAANRVTTTRWTDNDLMRRRVKPNGTEDSYAYNALGERTEHTRDPETGADEVQEYVYDANGNRTLDERGQRTAPNDAADLNLRYNARDQLVFWRRPADRGRVSRRGWETTYRLNATGAVQTRTERDPDVEDVAGTPRDESVRVESEFDFDGDRIDSVTTEDWEQAVDGHRIVIRQSHRYDDAGNTQRVFTDASALGSSTPITLGAPAHGAVDDDTCPKSDAVGMEGDGERKAVSRFCFDAFNRQTFSSGYGLEDAQSIEYDGLDRRDRTTTSPQGQPERVRDFTYLGLTELLIREAPATGTATNRYVYDYDSRGDRVGQQSSRDNGYRTYAKDVNGSVVGLESATQGVRGAIDDANRYDFDPYGELDRDETADCDGPDGGTQACSETQKGTSEQTRFGLSQDAEENPFRFEGFYHDSGVRSYDMHARQYRPQSTAFLSRDIYASAAGDWALQADPLTQDRYAFAGGNPVTNVEFDGHEPPTSHNQKAKQHLHNKNGACMGCNDDRKTIQARKRAPAGPDWFGQRRRPNHLKTEFQPEGPLSKRRPANADGGKSQTIDAQLTKKVDIEPLVKTLIGGSPTEILANVFPAGRAANQIRRGGKALRDGLRGSDDAGDAAKGPKVSGGACSFSGQTLVLMGDGTKKPISEIRVGDRVIATDPETGKQSVRTVTRVWVHTDRLATLRLEGEELTTTEDHPFWNVTDQAWQRADALDRGDFLATPDGEYVRFGDLGPDAYRGTAYNLTVAGVHTYHVGRNAVLVHNDCINWGANSVPTFGHTFSDHGAGAKVTRSLVGRAARTGTPQGQWLNNDAAAAFLRSVHVEGAGPRSVRLPAGLGQVVHPDGSIGPAKAVTIIPRRDGVIRSAFPIPGG